MGALAVSAASLTGCGFPHSDNTVAIIARLGWDSPAAGTALCNDWVTYQWETTGRFVPCPDWVRNGDGPR